MVSSTEKTNHLVFDYEESIISLALWIATSKEDENKLVLILREIPLHYLLRVYLFGHEYAATLLISRIETTFQKLWSKELISLQLEIYDLSVLCHATKLENYCKTHFNRTDLISFLCEKSGYEKLKSVLLPN